MLAAIGAQIPSPKKAKFNGLDVDMWPRVSWSPLLAMGVEDLRQAVDASSLSIGGDSVMVIDKGEVAMKNI